MLLCACGKRSIQRCLWEAARQEGSSFIENQFSAFWCKMLWCLLILMTAWPRGAVDRDGTARQVAFVYVCLFAACQEAYSKLLEQEACSTGCASQPAEPEIKRRKVNIFTRCCLLKDGLWPPKAPVQRHFWDPLGAKTIDLKGNNFDFMGRFPGQGLS